MADNQHPKPLGSHQGTPPTSETTPSAADTNVERAEFYIHKGSPQTRIPDGIEMTDADEPAPGRRWQGETLKEVTGGGTVTTRGLSSDYQQPRWIEIDDFNKLYAAKCTLRSLINRVRALFGLAPIRVRKWKFRLSRNPAPTRTPLRFRPISRLFADQFVSRHHDPVGERDESRQCESQADRVATVAIRQSEADIDSAVVIAPDAEFVFPLGPVLDHSHSPVPSSDSMPAKVAETGEVSSDFPGGNPGGVLGLAALNLLRQFADWQDRAAASDMTTDTWDEAWARIGMIADNARTLLAQMEAPRG